MQKSLVHISHFRTIFDDIRVMILVGLSRDEFRGAAKLVFGNADSQITQNLLIRVEHQHEIFVIVIEVVGGELEMFAQKPPHSIDLRDMGRVGLALS